jgi:hypothetical protein
VAVGAVSWPDCRQQEGDRLREHARHIAAWVNEQNTLTLRNGSEEPAYGVSIIASREEGYDSEEQRLPVLYETGLLPPGGNIDTEAEVPTPMGTRAFRLVFTDARGIRWVRESGGFLVRIDPDLDVGRAGAWAKIQKTQERQGDGLT